jgi:hypothetical protein
LKIVFFIFGMAVCLNSFAQDDSSESAIQNPSAELKNSADNIRPQVKGAIQKTTPETKKIVKKIMNRKKKSKSGKEITSEIQTAPDDSQEAPTE